MNTRAHRLEFKHVDMTRDEFVYVYIYIYIHIHTHICIYIYMYICLFYYRGYLYNKTHISYIYIYVYIPIWSLGHHRGRHLLLRQAPGAGGPHLIDIDR